MPPKAPPDLAAGLRARASTAAPSWLGAVEAFRFLGLSVARAPPLRILDPRVHPSIDQVGDQAADQDGDRADQVDGHDRRVVSAADGRDRQRPHPRPGEDLLDDHRPAQQLRQGEGDDRDQRDQGVAQA